MSSGLNVLKNHSSESDLSTDDADYTEGNPKTRKLTRNVSSGLDHEKSPSLFRIDFSFMRVGALVSGAGRAESS